MPRRTAALLTGLVLLTACSDEPGTPSNLPPLTAAPTTSAAPTPSPLPSELTANDAFGASAFTKHWFQVITETLQTNDTRQLVSLSDRGCESCQNFVEAARSAAADGRTTPELRYELQLAEASPPEAGKVLVDVVWRVSAFSEFARDGSRIRSQAATDSMNGQVLLGRRGSGWVVLGFRTVKAP